MTKLSELKLFLSHSTPTVVCITETHLQERHSPRFPGYVTYRQDRGDGFGGLLVLVGAQLQQKAVALDAYREGQMQSLAVEIAHQQSWSKIFLFYNPCCPVTQAEFEHYISLVGPNDIICGDFNAHHPLWGGSNAKQNYAGISLFLPLASRLFCSSIVLAFPPA
jgi:hypothetical protein